jgi:hypothetical protein
MCNGLHWFELVEWWTLLLLKGLENMSVLLGDDLISQMIIPEYGLDSVVARLLREADNLTSVSPLFRQCWILNMSQPYKPPRPATGIAFHLAQDGDPWRPLVNKVKNFRVL